MLPPTERGVRIPPALRIELPRYPGQRGGLWLAVFAVQICFRTDRWESVVGKVSSSVVTLSAVLLLVGCGTGKDAEGSRGPRTVNPSGSTESAQSGEAPEPSCGRVEAAARFSMVFFDAMGDMAQACADGHPLACNPANYVIGGLAGVFYAPVGFLIGLGSEEIETYHCREVSPTRTQEAARPEDPGLARTSEYQLWLNAIRGDADAEYRVGERLEAEESPAYRRAGRCWYCRAAHRGHGRARYRLAGFYHAERSTSPADVVQAYLWYELAVNQRVEGAAAAQAKLARTMAPGQIAQAEKLALAWHSDPDSCREIAVTSPA